MGRRPRGESRASGSPSTAWSSRLGVERLEQARHHVDLDVQVPDGADESDLLVVALAGERDDDSVDSVLRDDRGQCSGGPSRARRPRSERRRRGSAVHEADELDPVLRMLLELAAHELADLTGADDDRVAGRSPDGGGRGPGRRSARPRRARWRGTRRRRSSEGSGRRHRRSRSRRRRATTRS